MSGAWDLSAAELKHGYAAGSLSPVEVVDEVLRRIDALNPRLRAYLATDPEGARAAAREAERIWRQPGAKPLLCGVPVSVKDTIEIDGMPTTYGSLAFRDHRAPDSEIGKRLRRAGAVIVGKTNTPEFALVTYTNNRLGLPGANPWDTERTCGGSSGGAAAAVAAGLGPIAIGTDSGGSIRLPAAYNGIFGFKPTFGRVPAVQLWRASPARSHNGPLTRTVGDAALALRVIAGYDPHDPASALPPLDVTELDLSHVRGKVIGVVPAEGSDGSLVAEAALLLRDLGGATVEAPVPPAPTAPTDLEPGVWAYSGDHYAAAEALIADFWEKHADDLTEYARPIYDGGRRALAWHYRGVLRLDSAFVHEMQQWFRSYDYIITRTAAGAPPYAMFDGLPTLGLKFPLLRTFNIAGNPAAAVPFGSDDEGLPLALHVVGRHGDDAGVLAVCAAIEAARPWADRWPPLAGEA